MIEKQNIRDSFWNTIFKAAKKDKNIILVSADLAAPALDQFREEIPNQFISVGIAEQTAITVAAGLAMQGKKVYVYACSPFIFMRCYEQIKLAVADTDLPITIVGQGYGLTYVESGVTHHILEDIGAIRMLPKIRIFTPSDTMLAERIAEASLGSEHPIYVRLDRPMPDKVYNSIQTEDFNNGFSVIRKGEEILFCSCGRMLHTIIHVADRLLQQKIKVGIVDIFAVDVDVFQMIDVLKEYKQVYVFEEHTVHCGLGSYLAEICMDYHVFIDLKRYGLESKNKGYIHKYGSREYLWKLYGLDTDDIYKVIIQQIEEQQ